MRPLIVANWKMNPQTLREAQQLFLTIQHGLEGVKNVDVVICPPLVYLQGLKGYGGLAFGSQDCFWEQEGAYTGEVSPQMLKNLGCSYVILGHSERKKYLGETLEMVNKKIKAALVAGLIPVVCLGEEFEKEMEIIFHGIKNWKLEIKNLVLVYEPEWAISTGHVPLRGTSRKETKPASKAVVQAAFKKMRSLLPETCTLLYGGSVNSKDIKEFMGAGAAGALVGAASLDAQEFIQLAKNSISS